MGQIRMAGLEGPFGKVRMLSIRSAVILTIGRTTIFPQKMTTPPENAMPNRPQPELKPRSIISAVLLGGGILIFIKAFPLLSPILLSFLLILLISLAFNPLIHRMRNLAGGR